jgi:hypothetical protein
VSSEAARDLISAATEIDPALQERASALFDEFDSTLAILFAVIDWLDTQDDLTAIDILDNAIGELAEHEAEAL